MLDFMKKVFPPPKEERRVPRTRSRTPHRRARSKSSDGYKHSGRDVTRSGGRSSCRNNSRPHCGGGRKNDVGNSLQHSPERKPDLWAAVERADEGAVQTLLQQGKNPEEKYKGWTPLMKASEENATEILRILIKQKCDMEAVNKKGRTALSFAAAPSNDGNTRRPTPVGTLRFLLEQGANTKHRDTRGMTAKDSAAREKRKESLQIFEEFGV